MYTNVSKEKILIDAEDYMLKMEKWSVDWDKGLLNKKSGRLFGSASKSKLDDLINKLLEDSKNANDFFE